ncbi:AI-2E family transporter [Flavobacterium sp. NRK F10]|uniref:AI-2E family transporter n=1 Tax=Flavobacterium sediminis TaxID=2201181 RepID=A0A2U8QYM4_9FLAO|nr:MULTISPECIES: AI-2E family transporter [Flavobacterium]AWM14915.1 AI-2E family transporter [Flavobacterium sediminis]MCO6176172.1 AI-2E family transporter [Flavobacterium sp. NRK F10]
MTSKELSNGILRTIGILCLIVVGFYLAYKLSALLIYILISLVLTLLTNPVVQFLKRKLKFKNTLAVITTLFLVLLLISGFILLFVPLLITQGQNLSLLDIKTLENNYNELIQTISHFLETNGFHLEDVATSDIFSALNLNFLSDFFNSLLNFISNLGIGLASVLFVTFFLLKEKDSFFNAFKAVLPDEQKSKVLTSIDKINQLLSRYFGGLLLQLFIILILNLIVFLIFGVENAFIIALLCAILNIIPYLGPLLAMIVASSLVMLSGIGQDFINDVLPTTLYVIIGMTIVQLIDNNINQPIIFSKSTKSHPLEIFLVILASGSLFGVLGMIVAVPTYTALKVIAKEFLPNNRLIKALTKNI